VGIVGRSFLERLRKAAFPIPAPIEMEILLACFFSRQKIEMESGTTVLRKEIAVLLKLIKANGLGWRNLRDNVRRNQ
jgi:hypothetical protein